MRGKVCMVVGSSTGIGKATAMQLAQMGATVLVVCRNADRGKAARDEIQASSGNTSVDLLLTDLSSQQAVRELATAVQSRYPRLDVLINNAAISPSKRVLTVDGIESALAVNHLAPFLLTNLLLDQLKASAPARVVNVAAAGHSLIRAVDFDNLQGEKQFKGVPAYHQTKLFNILFTYELARRLDGSNVTANCLHPGAVGTDLWNDQTGFYALMYKVARPFMKKPEQAAATSVYLASAPEVEGVTGKYFQKKTEAKSSPLTYDEALCRRLWQVSEELTGLSVPTRS